MANSIPTAGLVITQDPVHGPRRLELEPCTESRVIAVLVEEVDRESTVCRRSAVPS